MNTFQYLSDSSPLARIQKKFINENFITSFRVTIIVATGPNGKLCMEIQICKYATILLAGLTCRTLRISKRRVLRAGVIIIDDGVGVHGGQCSSSSSIEPILTALEMNSGLGRYKSSSTSFKCR
jgi:hypothetical protein